MGQGFLLDTDLLRDEGLYRAALEGLSPRRREKAGAYRFDKDRRLSVGVGAALDYGLSRLGLRERDLPQETGERGKPYFPGRPEVHFNLSHSGHLALCVLSSQAVGVDVEELGRAEEALIRRVCTPREAETLLALEGEERQDRFTRLWTEKESYMKLLGTGLSLPPGELEIAWAEPETICRQGVPQPAAFQALRLEEAWLAVCTEREEELTLSILGEKELRTLYDA